MAGIYGELSKTGWKLVNGSWVNPKEGYKMNISKTGMKKTEYSILKACMSKDKTRQQLQVLNFTKDYVESTDGRILVRLAIENDIEPGAYRVISENKLGKYLVELVLEKTDIVFPNTGNVIPKENGEYMLLGIEDNCLGVSGAMIKAFQYSENAISYENMEKLCLLNSVWNMYKYGKEKPSLFTSENGKYLAVIMPFCVNDIKIEKSKA